MFLVWIATNKHQIEKIGEQTHGLFPGLHQEDLKFLMKAVSSVEFCFLRNLQMDSSLPCWSETRQCCVVAARLT
jgi:hypothetical protein